MRPDRIALRLRGEAAAAERGPINAPATEVALYRRILVPLDGSSFGEHALPTAIAQARRLDATLDLVTVAAPETSQGEDARERGQDRATTYLNEVQSRIRSAGFEGPVSIEVISAGNVAHSLVRHAEKSGADLFLMTTHGRGALKRAWLGSTADGVIRRSPVPVLLLRPEVGEDETEPVDLAAEPRPYRKILVPLDGSRAAEEMLAVAPSLTASDAEFTLLRVVAPFIPGGSPYLPHVVSETRDQEVVQEAARDYLEGVPDRFELGDRTAAVQTRLEGQAGLAIIDVARDEAMELIAISTTGRGGVARLLLGSVADKVIRGAPCPVLVYRKPESE